MPLFRQLELPFRSTGILPVGQPGVPPGESLIESAGKMPAGPTAETAVLLGIARELFCANGGSRIANEIRVKWNARLKSCAGRADYRQKLITLNPLLIQHPGEIDRTLRHELAHLLAQFRAGRRRILPHGIEWQQACRDLGIGDEKRCHNLPLAGKNYRRRFLYRCPKCSRDFPRVRRIRRALACLACCRKHNRGKFDLGFRLRLVSAP